MLLRVHSEKAKKRQEFKLQHDCYTSVKSGGNRQSDNNQPNTSYSFQTILLIIILLLITIGFGTAVFIEFNKKGDTVNQNSAHPQDILFGNEYTDDTIPNLGNGHLIIDRKQWGSIQIDENSTKIVTLPHPIPYVIITHIGVQSKPCDNVYSCSIKMRTIQDSAIAERSLIDMPANFYVSNDGYIYVGRGWNLANAYSNSSLAVCFMGDYIRYDPSKRQLEGVRYLLDYGLTRRFIAHDYKLVAHNQTRITKSPGTNVYREIIKWRRWYPCGINGNANCNI